MNPPGSSIPGESAAVPAGFWSSWGWLIFGLFLSVWALSAWFACVVASEVDGGGGWPAVIRMTCWLLVVGLLVYGVLALALPSSKSRPLIAATIALALTFAVPASTWTPGIGTPCEIPASVPAVVAPIYWLDPPRDTGSAKFPAYAVDPSGSARVCI